MATVPTADVSTKDQLSLAYTPGVVFFVLDEKIHYSHFIWHLFVLAGTTCHFFAVLLYAF